MKMSDLHIELEEGAPTRCAQCGWILRPGAGHRFRDGLYCTYCYGAMKVDLERALAQTPKAEKEPIQCAYCGGLVDVGSTWYRSGHVYCSRGCAEMAGMEQQFPVRSGCGARWPSGTWGQSCLDQCTCIDKVVDKVILRLRDCFGLDI